MKTLKKENVLRDPYKTSRGLYIAEALFEYFIAILISGTYLAKLTVTIGISDGMTAILTALTSLAGLFQVFSIYLAHKEPVKRWIIPMQIFTNLLFSTLYLIPIFELDISSSLLFFCVILLARILSTIASPIKYNWFMSLVEPSKRGSFTATLQIVSTVFGMAFSFVAARVIDEYETAGNMRGAFLILTVTILVLTVIHALTLVFSKEKFSNTEKHESALGSVRSLFENQKYRRVVLTYALFGVASSVTINFLGTYQINELGFSMTFISILDIIFSVISVGSLYLCGRISLRRPYASLVRISHYLYIVAFVVIFLSNRANGFILYPIYRLFVAVGGASRAVSTSNIIFELAPPEDRTAAIAINTIISGITGFGSTLIVTPIFNYIQASGNGIFGLNMYAQQFLALISAIITVGVAIYYRLACKKLLENKEHKY